MINNDRVRTMTRLAIYEEGEGIADDKLNGYFKNDYIIGHMVGSFVSGTMACLLIVFVYCCYHYDTLITQLYENRLESLFSKALTVYAAFMFFFLAVSFFVYLWRYNAAKARLDRYNKRLERLQESYEKEDKNVDKHN